MDVSKPMKRIPDRNFWAEDRRMDKVYLKTSESAVRNGPNGEMSTK